MATATQINSKQCAAGFGVSTMALLNWRKGQVGKGKLPASVKANGGATTVRFDVDKMKAYAVKHGLKFDEKAALKADGEAKRGPVAKAVVKKAATAIKQKPVAKLAKPADKKTAALLKPKAPPLTKKAAANKPGTPVKPKAEVVKLPTANKPKDAIKPSQPATPAAQQAAP